MQNNLPNMQKGINKIRIIDPYNQNTILDNRQNRNQIFTNDQMHLENQFQQKQQPIQNIPIQIKKEEIIGDIPQQNFKLQSSPQQIAQPLIPYQQEGPNNYNNQLQGGSDGQFQKVNFQQKIEQNKDTQQQQIKQIGQNNFQIPFQLGNQIGGIQFNQTKPQTQPKPIPYKSKSPVARQVDQQNPLQNQFKQFNPPNQQNYNQQYEENNRRESFKTQEINNQQFRTNQLNNNQQYEENNRRESIKTQESNNQQIKQPIQLNYNHQFDDNRRESFKKLENNNQQQKPTDQQVYYQQYEDIRRREQIKAQEIFKQQFKPSNKQYYNKVDVNSSGEFDPEYDDFFNQATNLTKNIEEQKPIPIDQLQAANQVYPEEGLLHVAPLDQEFQRLNPHIPDTFIQNPNQPLYNDKHIQICQQLRAEQKKAEEQKKKDKGLNQNLPYQQIAQFQQQSTAQIQPNGIKQQYQIQKNPFSYQNQFQNQHQLQNLNQYQNQIQQDVRQQQIPPSSPLPNYQYIQQHQQLLAAQKKPHEIIQQNNNNGLYQNSPNQQQQIPPFQQLQPPQIQPNEIRKQQPPQIQPIEIRQQQQIQKKQIQIIPPNQPKFKQQKQQNKQKFKKNDSNNLGFQKNNIREPVIDMLHDLEQRDQLGQQKEKNVNELMNAQKQLGIDQMDDAQLYEYFTQKDLNEQRGLSQTIIRDIETFKIQDEQIEEECSICQENFNKGDDLCSLPCLHIFHSDCIKKCFERFKICPICRQPVI